MLQSAVLGLLARRGSWLSDDLDFLVQGGRGFAPAELLTPVNDHIAPGLRLVYASFAEVAPLNHGFTIGWRVLMQALAITLMGLLLQRILGSNWWVVIGTIFYAITPLSMPSFMSLSSGVNNLSAHVFGLLLLHATIDWHDGRRRRAVAYGPLSLLISVACWEKSALILVTAVALALYLRTDPLRDWLRGLVAVRRRSHRADHCLRHPLPDARQSVERPAARPRQAARAHSAQLRRAAVSTGRRPLDLGRRGQSMSVATPPVAAFALGGLVANVLVADAWRSGPACAAAVGVGRRLCSGDGAPRVLRTLPWVRVDLHRAYPLVRSLDPTHSGCGAVVRTVSCWQAVVPVACLVVGVVVSDAGFARGWGNNPAKAYFATVAAELDRGGQEGKSLWNTPCRPRSPLR